MQVHSSSPSWRRLAPPPHVTQHQWWSGSSICGTTKLQRFLLELCSSSDSHSLLLTLSVMSYSKYCSQVIITHMLTVLSACVRALVSYLLSTDIISIHSIASWNVIHICYILFTSKGILVYFSSNTSKHIIFFSVLESMQNISSFLFWRVCR